MTKNNTVKLVFLFIFLIFSTLTTAVLNDADLYFSFDDDDTFTTISKDSAGNSNGTIGGGLTTGSTGLLGEAYSADGSNRWVSYTSTSTAHFTMSMWIKGTTNTDTWSIDNEAGSRSSVIRPNLCAMWIGGTAHTITPTVSLINDAWHHVVCSYDGDTLKLYVDGVLDGQNLAPNGDANTWTNTWHIFKRKASSPVSFIGSIDEVGYWNRAVSDASCTLSSTCGGEIADLYNGGSGFNPYASVVPSTPFFEILAKDDETLSNIQNITITLQNGSTYTNTTQPTVILPFNNSEILNFTVSANKYFNQTYINYNSSFDLIANITIYPYLEIKEAYENTSINNFNVSFFNDTLLSQPENRTYFSFNNFTEDNKFYYEYNNTINFTVSVEGARDIVQNLNSASNKKHIAYIYFPKVFFSFGNYTEYSGINYTRLLNYNVTFSNCINSGNFTIIINGTQNYNNNGVSCGFLDPVNNTFNFSYAPLFEADVNISARMDGNSTDNNSFSFDLNNPSVIFTTTDLTQGFVSDFDSDLSLICSDTVTPLLTYNLSINNNDLFFGNLSNGTVQTNTTELFDGDNTATGSCSDFFGTTKETEIFTAYVKRLNIINEKTGNDLALTNLTSVRAWFDDNSTFFDFKAEGTTEVYVLGVDLTKIRLELQYPNDDIIVRYLDLKYINTGNFTVCGMPNGTKYYEQLLISATQTAAAVKNQFTDCFIAADTTRFAYQDANVLRAFTIDSSYYLYTFDVAGQVLLASLDGSISSFTNLDRLDFAQTAYNFNIDSTALTFQKTGTTEIQIYYKNLQDNNDEAELNITRMDTGQQVFSTKDFTDPNEFTLYFDYSTLSNVTESTLFRLDMYSETSGGTGANYVRYFNTDGGSGIINNAVAIAISIFLLIFGLTLTAARLTFSWFGIIVAIAAIAILALSAGSWITLFIQGMALILLVYIVISMLYQNKQTLV